MSKEKLVIKLEEPTNDEPIFKSFDEIANHFKGEVDELKKLIKPDKSTRQSKDDFKLYHEQTENKLNEINNKILSMEGIADTFKSKLSNSNTREVYDSLYDFFFKW